MIIRNSFITLFLTLLFLLSSVVASENNPDVGTSAFNFLKINTGARAVAMGGAFTGLANDANSVYYNPAGIATIEDRTIIAGYHNYFAGMQSGVLGIIGQYKKSHHYSVQINYLNYGTFIETNKFGEIEGEFGGGDLLFAVSYARQYSNSFSFGVTSKIIYEKIQEFSATGIAFDFGVKYRGNRDRYTAGLMIQNVGVKLSNFRDVEKDDLPFAIRAGAGVRPRGLAFQLVGDVIYPSDNDIYVALGLEYYELKPLYIRVGWSSFGSNYRALDSDDSFAGLSIGFGIDWKNKQISYALTSGADLGESHRITITGGI